AADLPSTSFDRTTGAFEVSNVPAGSYALDAAMLAANPSTTLSSFTRVRIDVASDVDNLEVPIRSGMTVSGRIDGEGLASASDMPGYENLRVNLVSTLLPQSRVGSSLKIAANGTFTIENVSSGEYRVRVTGLPPNTYVKSALIGVKDILQEPLVIGTVPPPAMTILISRNAAQVAGTIVDASLNPVPGTQAVLVPDQSRDHHDLYKTVACDGAGHFTIQGITPADYKLFAWEDLEPYSYFDPAVLQQFESLGKRIHLVESSRETVTLSVIPAR
ncbi:MAG TPA: hypothetical protein VK210_01665, partial [Terriglobia bacterium]|nr:hypothetical protein [Terriglobia bacterium]